MKDWLLDLFGCRRRLHYTIPPMYVPPMDNYLHYNYLLTGTPDYVAMRDMNEPLDQFPSRPFDYKSPELKVERQHEPNYQIHDNTIHNTHAVYCVYAWIENQKNPGKWAAINVFITHLMPYLYAFSDPSLNAKEVLRPGFYTWSNLVKTRAQLNDYKKNPHNVKPIEAPRYTHRDTARNWEDLKLEAYVAKEPLPTIKKTSVWGGNYTSKSVHNTIMIDKYNVAHLSLASHAREELRERAALKTRNAACADIVPLASSANNSSAYMAQVATNTASGGIDVKGMPPVPIASAQQTAGVSK